jgi:hypothetical protein
MTTKDPIPHGYDPELVDACKNLYDVMSYPFERDFSSFGYSLELSATPEKDAILYLAGGVKDTLEEELGLIFDRTNEWRVLFHHDESSDRLRADTVGIPFIDKQQQAHTIILKHLPGIGYVPLTETTEGNMKQWLSEDQELEKEVFGRSSAPVVSPDTISELLDEAGFRLEVPNAPQSRFTIAKNLDTIKNWTRCERIVVPISPDLQVILKKESVHAIVDGRHDSGGVITAYAEEVYSSGVRDQLVISLPIDGGIVEAPEVLIRKLRPSSDPSDIAKHGPNAYRVEEESRVPLTAELADRLSADLMEDLGDIS